MAKKISFYSNENVLNFIMVMVVYLLCILKAIQLCTLNEWIVMDYISIKLFIKRIWKYLIWLKTNKILFFLCDIPR